MGFPFEETLSTNPKTQIVIDDDNELGLMAVRLANAAAFPMVLKASLELGVFDTLYADAARHDSFLSPSEIASRLPTKPRNPEASVLLDRMLRLLASYSMVKCSKSSSVKSERVYRAEPICRFFLKDNIQDIGSLASQVIVNFDSVFLNTWAQLKDVVLEGGDAFGRAHGGMKLFDYMGTDERFSKLFNQTGFTIAVVKKALEVYQGFNDVKVLVDVGGGVGNTLGVVTSKYPHIKGINFDLTCALEQAPSYPGVAHIAGDMFVDVPKGDTMILKRILHDWTDEDCVKILKNCWKSLPNNGKIVVIELVTPDDAENGDINANIAFDMDMLMFTQCSGGKERSRAEFKALAAAAGFNQCKFVCQAYHCWIIEFCKEDV
ncbi:Indole glucosinolate O-methyltransferase 4 [Hirschfeldia incana]|nr:Indole glucosinolate O-methyltransferase 4 [Hirschfeldia incana]